MDKRIAVVLGISALAIGIAAIAGGGSKESSSGPVATKTVDLNLKPVIPKQGEPAPTTLVEKDIVLGTGPEAKAGDKAYVRYVGVDYSTGAEFDASWNRPGNSFDFQIGSGGVIPCWEQGVIGMKVGGRRQLTCPPGLAYGAQGSPPTIQPNATLVFVVDLKKLG